MAENEGNGGAVLLAFLAGAVAGAAVALWFAPAAGPQTREYLGQKAKEGRDKAAEAARGAREAIQRQRDTIASAIERGRDAYRDAREKENA